MAETWIINEPANFYYDVDASITFTSNNTIFHRFNVYRIPDSPTLLEYDDELVAESAGEWTTEMYFTNQAYRTVTFETAPTGHLLTWLQAFAEKQAQPANITLDLSTIGLSDGTHSIQMKLSDEGLTKVDSDLSEAVTYEISSWEYPVEDGDDLIITQAHTITEDGDNLIIE